VRQCLEDDKLRVTGRVACAAGALSTTCHGAIPSMPSYVQVEQLLGQFNESHSNMAFNR
jgi:sugar/nucleoside kinase (ribokinase family)